MMNRFFLYAFLIFTVSCRKESTDEYATGDSQTGIVGKWKLVETRHDTGGGYIHVADKTSENRIISFDSKGKATDTRLSCGGEYTFTPIKNGNDVNGNLIISFGCTTSTEPGKYSATIEDNNQLAISDGHCIELCLDVYRRLRE